MSETWACPSCGGAMEVFHRVNGVPANSCILMQSAREAVTYPQGNIALGFCNDCGFISNTAFDKALTEYSGRYEETQGFSPTFNKFHQALAERLIDRYGLYGKTIVEIGCGKGEFLAMLCEMGGNRGIGFDPGFSEERVDGSLANRMTVVKDFYSERYADHEGDLLVCKMTLEHIHPVGQFIATVRKAVGDDPATNVFFQIPEAMRIVRDCAFEDIYYEHCSYFTPGSLSRLFRASGFLVQEVGMEYEGQYLTIEARPGRVAETAEEWDDELERMRRYVKGFPAAFELKRRIWRERLNRLAADGTRTVLWGSGSKGVSFLTTLEVTDEVGYAVDINPYRAGYYMPGTGHEIVSPEFLRDYQPEAVIVMNPIYRREIKDMLKGMDLEPEIYTL